VGHREHRGRHRAARAQCGSARASWADAAPGTLAGGFDEDLVSYLDTMPPRSVSMAAPHSPASAWIH
jgi:hypothetical protein